MREKHPLKVALAYDGELKRSSGVSNYVLTVGEYLQDRGHEVSYVVGRSEIDDERIRSFGRAILIPLNGAVQYASFPISKANVNTILELDPDVFHVQAPYHSFFSGRVLKRLGGDTATIATFHTLPETMGAWIVSRTLATLNRKTAKRIDHAFSASPALQHHARDLYRTESELVPLPVNVDRLKTGQSLPGYDDKLNLLFMGRFEPRKGCAELLGALSLVDKDIQRQVRLLIAGEGPLRSQIEAYVKAEGLKDTVEFLGYIDEEQKPDMLATSNIAIFPSTSGESFGLVIAEAMAATSGIVVGGNNPGYREALGGNEETLFDPLSPIDTAAFLTNLIRDEEKRARIRQFQQQLVKNYDIKTIGPKIEAAYFRVLAKKQQL